MAIVNEDNYRTYQKIGDFDSINQTDINAMLVAVANLEAAGENEDNSGTSPTPPVPSSLWSIQYSGITAGSLIDVNFVDANHGWSVGTYDDQSNAAILNTTDGGNKWNIQYSGITGCYLFSVDFVDVNHGWAVGSDNTNMVILKYSK